MLSLFALAAIPYTFSSSFCAHYGAAFKPLGWPSLPCAYAKAEFRDALSAWTLNSAAVKFVESARHGVVVSFGRRYTDDATLAVAWKDGSAANVTHVEFNSDLCWRLDTFVCDALRFDDSVSPRTVAAGVSVVLTIVVGGGALGVACLLAICMAHERAISRCVWLGLIVSGLGSRVAWEARSCSRCESFKRVAVHEVGHVLGLPHVQAGATCGCGNDTRACTTRDAKDTMMTRTVEYSVAACPTAVDVDALHRRSAERCAAPMPCVHNWRAGNYHLAYLSAWVVLYVACVSVGIDLARGSARKCARVRAAVSRT